MREPKYKLVARSLEGQLDSGAWALGRALPPIRTLMKDWDVSLATVNKAIEILEQRGRVIRLHGKGVFVTEPIQDRPGQGLARVEVSAKPLQVMAICEWKNRPEAPAMWWTRILRGIETGLTAPRTGGVKLGGASDFHTPRDLVEALRRQGIDSVVSMGDHWKTAERVGMARAVREAGMGMVMVWSGQAKPWPTHSVDVDNRGGILALVEHLAGLGHRRVGFVGYDAPWAWLEARRLAFFEAAELAGLSPVDHRLPDGPGGLARPFDFQPGGETAFVCANDDIAAHLVGDLRRKGLRVPEQVSVTGFDDDYRHRESEITTVRADLERIGREAVDLLAALRDGRWDDRTVHLQVPAPVVIRHTTGPVPVRQEAKA